MRTKVIMEFELPKEEEIYEEARMGGQYAKAFASVVNQVAFMRRDKQRFVSAEDALTSVWKMLCDVIEANDLPEE